MVDPSPIIANGFAEHVFSLSVVATFVQFYAQVSLSRNARVARTPRKCIMLYSKYGRLHRVSLLRLGLLLGLAYSLFCRD